MFNDKLLKIIISVVSVIVIVHLVLYFTSVIDLIIFTSLISGTLLTSVNFLSGIIAIRMGINKPFKDFIKVIFGGMTLRLFFTAGFVILLVLLLQINLPLFILNVFIFYIIFLIFEIYYLLKYQKQFNNE